MSRHSIHEAIVLHQTSMGEIHSILTLLTPGAGVIRVIAHGIRGAKSRLRPHCQVYSHIRAYLYEEPKSKTIKLTDAESIRDFQGIRESLKTVYHAAVCSEIIGRSSFDSHDTWIFPLFLSWLGIMESGSRLNAERVDCCTIQFLWKFLTESGLAPDVRFCAQTGTLFDDSDTVIYRPSMGGFCVHTDKTSTDEPGRTGMILSSGCLAYLRFTGAMGIANATQVGLWQQARHQLLQVLLMLVQDLLGSPLKSLQSGSPFFE